MPLEVQGVPVYNSREYRSLEDYGGLGIKVVRERPDLGDRVMISRPSDLEPLLEALYQGKEKEYFFSLILDARNRVDSVDLVSIGSLNASLVHPREVYRLPLILSAGSIITSHNHPSQDCTPSREDLELVKRLVKAGEVVGVEMVDHLIYGAPGRYLSLKEAGLF